MAMAHLSAWHLNFEENTVRFKFVPEHRALKQMLVGLVFVVLITVKTTELASCPLLYLTELRNNTFPVLCAAKQSNYFDRR